MMSSIRIMSACFATGQAAGTAAALGIKAGGIDLGDIDTDILRKWLRKQKFPAEEGLTY